MNVDQWLLQHKYWQRKERPVNLQLTDLVTFRLTYWPCLCETCLSKPKRERKEKKFDKLSWSQIIYVVPGKFSTFFFGLPLRNSRNISRTFLFERRRGWGERDARCCPLSGPFLIFAGSLWEPQAGSNQECYYFPLMLVYRKATPGRYFFCRYPLYTCLERVIVS